MRESIDPNSSNNISYVKSHKNNKKRKSGLQTIFKPIVFVRILT